jgi:hypothetical protein
MDAIESITPGLCLFYVYCHVLACLEKICSSKLKWQYSSRSEGNSMVSKQSCYLTNNLTIT